MNYKLFDFILNQMFDKKLFNIKANISIATKEITF